MTSYKYSKLNRLYNEIDEIKAILKEKEKQLKELQNEFMQDVPADTKIKHKNIEFYYKIINSKTLDSKRLKAENIEVYNSYLVEKISNRFYRKEV